MYSHDIVLGNLDTNFLEQLDEVVHVQDVRHIGDAHGSSVRMVVQIASKRLVLGSLWCDGTLERMTALYDERLHRLL